MIKISCCKDCQVRSVNCHAKCSVYIKEKQERETEKEKVYKERKTFMITNSQRFMLFGEPKRKVRYYNDKA